VILNGPYISYKTSTAMKSTAIPVSVSQLGQQKKTAPFNLEVLEYSQVVTVDKTKFPNTEPLQGNKKLSEIVDNTGPIFQIDLNKNGSNANISLLGAIQKDSDFTPEVKANIGAPAKIKTDQ
jgi:hypothetical protein